jgi:low temperature requirement protein LtrA
MSAEPLVAADSAAEVERRTSYLELFFDLVFVFAITQVATLIVSQPTAGGFARSALVLALIWWAWSGFAWMTNAIDIESEGVRLTFLLVTAGSFFMALAVPHAYADEGAWFAVPYVAVRVVNVALYVWGLRADAAHQRAMFKLAPWFLTSPFVALAGGLANDTNVRTTLWVVSLTIDVAGAFAVRRSGFRVQPSHFAERYALFVIIALGESVVAIGVGAADQPRDGTFAAAVLVAFAGTAALWWAYFDFTAIAVERALRFRSEEERPELARDLFTFFHYFQVLGIIFFAVALKKTLEHPLDPLSGAGRAALALGGSLPLLATVLGRFRVTGHVARERVTGIAAIVVVALALTRVDAMVVLLLVDALLVATIVAETFRLREARRVIRADGPPV